MIDDEKLLIFSQNLTIFHLIFINLYNLLCFLVFIELR